MQVHAYVHAQACVQACVQVYVQVCKCERKSTCTGCDFCIMHACLRFATGHHRALLAPAAALQARRHVVCLCLCLRYHPRNVHSLVRRRRERPPPSPRHFVTTVALSSGAPSGPPACSNSEYLLKFSLWGAHTCFAWACLDTSAVRLPERLYVLGLLGVDVAPRLLDTLLGVLRPANPSFTLRFPY